MTIIPNKDNASWRLTSILDATNKCWEGYAAGESLEHNPDWLALSCDHADKNVLLIQNPEGKTLPLFTHDGNIDLRLSTYSITSLPVRRYVLTGDHTNINTNEWSLIFDALRKSIPDNSAIFVLGMRAGEDLHTFISSNLIKRQYHIVSHGPEQPRRTIMLPGGFETYINSIKKNRRKDLLKSLRRFNEEFGSRSKLVRFCTPSEITSMLQAIEPISEKTYQNKDLGIGVKASNFIGNQAIKAAERGYARCYALTVDDNIIAWRLGYAYKGTYYSYHVGYDPSWHKSQPGIVLSLKSMQDIIDTGSFKKIDLLYGDNPVKRKFSTDSHMERNLYLFPKTMRGYFNSSLLKVVNNAGRIARNIKNYIQ